MFQSFHCYDEYLCAWSFSCIRIISSGWIPSSGITRFQVINIFKALDSHCQISFQKLWHICSTEGNKGSKYVWYTLGKEWDEVVHTAHLSSEAHTYKQHKIFAFPPLSTYDASSFGHYDNSQSQTLPAMWGPANHDSGNTYHVLGLPKNTQLGVILSGSSQFSKTLKCSKQEVGGNPWALSPLELLPQGPLSFPNSTGGTRPMKMMYQGHGERGAQWDLSVSGAISPWPIRHLWCICHFT